MESDNLRTASLYINNQLLSRGLLRDGQTIDFARPEKAEGGVAGTMARVMGVVNDLILRRDRDASQRETLSQTIRALHADSLRHTTELERISTKSSEAQRKLGVADAAERAMKQQLRSAEQAARGLKEEMARMKILVAQTRAQCANEVRKRERVIEGLKRHVGEGGRARGSGKVVGVVSVNVVAGVGAENGMTTGGTVGTYDTGYDLRMETNEFLTELARGLSEENENLGGLVSRTVETLRTLSGCERDGGRENGMVIAVENGYETLASETDTVIEHLRNLLTNPSFVPLEEVEVREEEIIRLREGWEKMESRWREAVQMMDGWRKRMARSGQTVNLEELKMGLMLSPLRMKGEGSDTAYHLSTLLEGDEDLTQADIDAMDDSGIPPPAEPDFDDELDDSDSSLFEEEPVVEVSVEVSDEQGEHNRTLDTASSVSPGPPPQLSPLKETLNGNRGVSRSRSPDKPFTTIIEENTYDLLQLHTSSPQKTKSTPNARVNNSIIVSSPSDEISLIKTSYSHSQPPTAARNPSPRKSSQPAALSPSLPTTTSTSFSTSSAIPKLQPPTAQSKLPRPRENALPPQSPLTMASIAAKLAATEREADAARVRAKLKAVRMGRMNATSNNHDQRAMPPPQPDLTAPKLTSDEMPSQDIPEDPHGDEKFNRGHDRDAEMQRLVDESEGRVRKRKATAMGRAQGGRATRRRSTLSPWELERVIRGEVDVEDD